MLKLDEDFLVARKVAVETKLKHLKSTSEQLGSSPSTKTKKALFSNILFARPFLISTPANYKYSALTTYHALYIFFTLDSISVWFCCWSLNSVIPACWVKTNGHI